MWGRWSPHETRSLEATERVRSVSDGCGKTGGGFQTREVLNAICTFWRLPPESETLPGNLRQSSRSVEGASQGVFAEGQTGVFDQDQEN